MKTRVTKTAAALDIGYAQGDDSARLTVSGLRKHAEHPLGAASIVPGVYRLHEEDRLVALAALTLFGTHVRPGTRAQDSRITFAAACSKNAVSETRVEAFLASTDLTAAARNARSIVGIISSAGGTFDYGDLAQLLANLSRAHCADATPTSAAQTFIIDYAVEQRRGAEGTPS